MKTQSYKQTSYREKDIGKPEHVAEHPSDAQFAEAGAHDFLEAITETDAVLEGAAGIAQAGGGVEAGLAVGRKARVDLDLLRRYRRRNEPDRDEKWKRSREHASHAVFSCDLGRGSKGEQIILIQIR